MVVNYELGTIWSLKLEVYFHLLLFLPLPLDDSLAFAPSLAFFSSLVLDFLALTGMGLSMVEGEVAVFVSV